MFRTIALLLLALPPASAETGLALRGGETLHYRVSWAILPGAGEITVAARSEGSGPEAVLRVATVTATRGLAKLVMPFEAKGESVFDATTGRIRSISEASQLRGKRAEHTVTFDFAAAKAFYGRPGDSGPPRALPLPAGDPMDLITQLVQTRTWALGPGEKRDALVLFEDDFYELTIYALRHELVRTPLGEFNTLVLEPRMEKTPPKGMFKRGSRVHVWISQDQLRLPVRFEVEFKIGTGVATLVRYDAPAAPADAGSAGQPPRRAPDSRP